MNTTSKSNLETSDQDQYQEENVSVFDFLYVDQSRISSILSQFSSFGGLTNIVHDKSAGRGKGDSLDLDAQASALVVKGRAQATHTTKAEYSESSQKSYDPRWVNVLSFLDEIEDRDLLQRDISQASFGDLVLLKGNISVTDFKILEQIWDMPAFKAMSNIQVSENDGNRHNRRKNNVTKSKNAKQEPTEIDIMFELAKALPHRIQLLIGDDPSAWGILPQEGLVSMASDFSLKFGGNIPGSWAMVGILDAIPDAFDDTSMETIAPTQVGGVFVKTLEPVIRQFLGRPGKSYGVTPLIVFREIGRTG